MVIAVIILVLAWSLGSVTEVLGTAQYLSQILSERLPLELLPRPGIPHCCCDLVRHGALRGERWRSSSP